MYVNRHNKVTKQFGFSLWELSIVMLIMIGLFVALISIMPYIVKRENVEVDQSILVKMDDQLLGFIATYSRMPCPDSTGNGLENRPNLPGATCEVSSGTIPYKTLGLNEDYAGVGSIPVQYAVYRNTATMADLANNALDLFNPTDSHGTTTTLGNTNGLDFCTAIANAKATTFSSTNAHVILPDGTFKAVPYVLVTAGLTNADGGASAFDGENANGTLRFESANKEHTAIYDDTVFTKSFDELASTLNCDTAQNSLHLLADGKATHEENLAQADNLKGNAELGAIILGAQILLGIANTAMAAFTLAQAVIVLGTASAALSASIASCIVLVGCAFIPIYTAGVIASVVAIVAGGVSVGANVAALITQAVAIGLIIDVANRAGAQISLPEDSSSSGPGDPPATLTNAELAVQVRQQAIELKADAQDKVTNARNSIGNAFPIATTVRDQMTPLRTRALALTVSNTAIGDAGFTAASNAAFTVANNNLNRANSARVNISQAFGFAVQAVAAFDDYPATVTALENADIEMAQASSDFSDINDTYLDTRTHATTAKNIVINLRNNQPARPVPADPFAPTPAEQTAINNWDDRRAALNLAEARANDVIAQVNATKRLFFTEVLDRRSDAAEARNEVVMIQADLAPLLSPPPPTQAELDERAALVAELSNAIAEQNSLITYYTNVLNSGGLFVDINRLQDDMIIAFGNIEGAAASTEEAYETIEAAINAEENALYFEQNIGSGLPNPNGILLQQAQGVDAILNSADLKGAEK